MKINNKIEQIIPEYNSKIDNVIKLFLKSNNDLEDIKQEVYIKIWKNLPIFEEGKNFWSWARKITVNHCKNYLRDSKKTSSNLQEDHFIDNIAELKPVSEHKLIQEEKQQLILDAINKLDKKLRDVVILYDFENLSYEEISRKINCPLGTVKSRLFRARMILKTQLKDLLLEQ